MTVLNTGTTKKYAEGWENIFGNKKPARASTSKKATKKTLAKKKQPGKK